MKHTAFTVWELLAFVVIVVVVAILLLPVFAVQKTRDPSRDCLSHEKQLALAVMQYSQDNDGHLPDIAAGLGSTNTWRNVIYPYCKSKNIYQCPSRKDKAIGPDGFPRSYAANYTGAYSGGKGDTGNGVFSGPGSEGISIKSIPALQNLIMLC